MNPPDDADRQAWLTAVFDRHERPLVQYAKWLTRDFEAARDIVQDTFLRLISENRSKLDGREAQWLFTVCRNRALDVRKRERRMKPLTEIQAESRESPDPSPVTTLDTRQTGSRVLGLVDGLPGNQQECVLLKFGAGLSYRQIAEVADLSVSNVGFLIHTAIKTLRKQLSTESGPSPMAEGGLS